jgi:TolB-like protein/Flp pilus assembly protein TadD
MLGGVAVIIALATTGLWLWKGTLSNPAATPQTPTIKAIALYPLDDLSGDPSQAYFAPGMTDALTTRLTQIRSLKVTGSVSAARCKEEKMPLPKVAEVLGVDAVVMGSVVRVGDTVRISVRLVEARTDSNLWADSYERKLSDVLTLQGEVAQAIATSVRAAVTPEEKARLAGRPLDPRAYDEYLIGLYELNQRGSKEHLLSAIAHFRKAVELDPGFAAPYSKLITVYGHQWFCGFITFEEAYAPAKAAALKVVEVAPSDAGTHIARANFMFTFERDLRGAESESRKAMELDDRAPNVGLTYGQILSLLGRDEEAIRVLRKVVELDPMSLEGLDRLAMAYMMAGRWDEGARCMDNYLELSTKSAFSYAAAGYVCVAAGDREKGLAYAKKARALPGWEKHYVNVANLAAAYARTGQREEALEMLRIREPLCIGNQMEEMDLGIIYAWLGERDRAFEHLEKGCFMPGWTAYQIGWWWHFPKEFRKDPRYIALVKKVGLPVRDEKGKVIEAVSR